MNQIETNDLFKGAYFLCCSCKLIETKLVDGNQIRFVIEGKDLSDLDQDYRTGNALVDPLRLKESLNYLRELLNQTLRTRTPKNSHVSKQTSRVQGN